MRQTPNPRYVSYASIDRGDRITVETRRGDVKETATAVVDRIERATSTVSFISTDGNVFGTFRYGSHARVILHDKAARYNPEPLFTELDERLRA